MPASIVYQTFTSDTTLFLNKAAANTFFSNLYVADANTSTAGAVKQAQTISFSPSAYANEDILELNMGASTEYVPTQAHIEAVKTRLEALETSYANLIAYCKTAGLVANS